MLSTRWIKLRSRQTPPPRTQSAPYPAADRVSSSFRRRSTSSGPIPGLARPPGPVKARPHIARMAARMAPSAPRLVSTT